MGTWMLVAILVGVFCFVVSQAIFRAVGGQSNAKQRIDEMKRTGPRFATYDGSGESLALDTNMASGSEMTLEPTYSPLAITLRGLLSLFMINVEKHRREKGMDYYRSGFNSPNHPIYFLAYQTFVGPILFVAGVYLIIGADAASNIVRAQHAILGILLIVFGAFGSKTLLKNTRQKREKKLTNSFPDMLDLLLVCVETGLALDGALARVTRELGKAAPEATEELNRTRLELSLLNDRRQALINLAQRTNLAPYKTLVGALLQSEQMGTSLTDTLRILSEDYRMRRLMDAETRAGRLPVLITIPLVCFMLPALFTIILTPVIINLMGVGVMN